MLKKIEKISKLQKIVFIFLRSLGFYNYINDEKYLKKKFQIMTGEELDLDNPQTFNEKLQWLKLHDRKDTYTTMVDKYAVKKYVADIIGEEYIIPTLGVYDKFDDIDFDKLPNQFVIKCTHDSGGLVIVRDKNNFDKKSARKKINKCLKRNYYYSSREWPYKNVKPRIIIEKYMEDRSTKDIRDYKFFTFSGKIACIQVDYDRFINHKRAFYDTIWNRLPFTTCYPTDYSIETPCPPKFQEMKNIVKKLINSIDNPAHVRVDLYSINGKIYFGEFTFYHGGGYEKFEPEEWNKKLGDLIVLSNKKELIK